MILRELELLVEASLGDGLKEVAAIHDINGSQHAILRAKVPVGAKLVLATEAKKIIADLEAKLKKAKNEVRDLKKETK